MPRCRCGHFGHDHSWQRHAYGECMKCPCGEYIPVAHADERGTNRQKRVPPPPVNNPYVRKLRR